MATNFTSTTLSGIYNDDFDADKNFHQMLFNSGRSLQARELTQLQTLLYEEMSRMGRNIFKEGATVGAGGAAVNAEYDFIQIGTVTGGTFADITVGSSFTDGNISCQVLEVQPQDVAAGFDVDTLYVRYTSSGQQAVSGEPVVFAPSASLLQVNGGFTLTVAATPTGAATAVTGKGTRVDVGEGDYFVVGRFVRASAQSLILSPYTQTANADVGFKVVQEVVTVNDDTTLYDNAGGGVNTASPGADRYRITLVLTTKSAITTESFVYVGRVENSKITDEIEPTDGYNKINDLLALRTNEESGDYIVNPFTLTADSADNENLSLTISSGLAYVNGYRVENPSPIELVVPRSTGTESVENEPVPIIYGNYILVEQAGSNDLPILDYEELNIYDDGTSGQGAVVGTCRVRGIEPSGDQFKVYLFDIQMNAGKAFETDAAAIGDATSNQQRFIASVATPATSRFTLFGTTDNDLLFPTGRPRPESITDIVLVRQASVTASSSGTDIVMPTLSGSTYADGSLWIIENVTDGTASFVPTTVTGLGTANATVTDASIVTGKTYRICYYEQVTTPTIATKSKSSLLTSTITGVAGVYDFGVPDVYLVESIQDTDASGADVSERFTLDDGQRDNFYADSRLLLKEGETAPTDIYVTYYKFDHGAGDFYAPESYDVPYADIPTHVLADGTEISLRDYLDFRSDKNDGTFSNIHLLPRNGTSITADINYYLPRADKILATQEGDIQLLMGQQSKDPQLKKTPDNSLELYQVLMNPNTANEDDIQVRAIEHKLYTMKDIAKLDNKVEELKQFTELNIAELRALHEPSLDSDGVARPESGVVVDDASDQTGSDTNNDDYHASIDPENNLVRPEADENNVRLVYENTLSTGTTKKGDNIYLSYTESTWANQDLASRSVNVNPFGLVDNVGTVKLSPSSDEWKETREEAVKALQGSGRLARRQAFLWNSWQWNWKGRSDEDLWQTIDQLPQSQRVRRRIALAAGADLYSSTGRKYTSGYVRRVIQSDTLRERIGNRIVDLALIPWIRSRKVYFKAQGLKPNTKFTPFFDGQDVSAWCREEAAFIQWADRTDDIGNKFTYASLAAHPDGTSELTTDDKGEVIGSFFIPNIRPTYYITVRGKRRKIRNNYIRFRSGIREFKLLDINVNDWAQADSKAFCYYASKGSLWHKWNNILNTRPFAYRWPLGLGPFPSVFNPKELRQNLDAITAGGVNIFQPQLAGQYGPNTPFLNGAALAGLDASGQMSQVLSDYINVNNKQFAGNAIKPLSIPQNPMAQEFYVDNQFGLTLTKVSLYFRTKPTDNQIPVSIHVRPIVNGKPSNNEIVPDSHVYLAAADVDAIGTGPTLSTVQGRPTEFAFDEPIFLQPWTSYAIVVTSASTDYTLFSAKTQEVVLKSDTRRVSTQPSAKALYLPQNGVFWNEAKDQSLMMKLDRAVFDVGGGSAILHNAPIPATQLETNPVRLTNASGNVYVKCRNHGLAIGDTVQLDDCEDIANIVAATSLNDINHTVTAVDVNGFQFVLPASATSNADITGGGERVLAQRNIMFDHADPNIETIIPNFTSVDVAAKFTTGIYVSGDTANRFKPNGESGLMSDAAYQKITPDQNIEFEKPRGIYNPDVTDGPSGLGSGTADRTHSCYFKVDFKTSNDYVSPILDMQRASLTIIGQVLDNQTNQVYNVAETEPSGGTAGSRHITTPVTLAEPAVGIEINTEVNLPPNADVDVYYRTAGADANIADEEWVYVEPASTIPNTDRGVYVRGQWLAGGLNGTLQSFQQAQTKFVFKGVDQPPSMKAIATKFLAT